MHYRRIFSLRTLQTFASLLSISLVHLALHLALHISFHILLHITLVASYHVLLSGHLWPKLTIY